MAMYRAISLLFHSDNGHFSMKQMLIALTIAGAAIDHQWLQRTVTHLRRDERNEGEGQTER